MLSVFPVEGEEIVGNREVDLLAHEKGIVDVIVASTEQQFTPGTNVDVRLAFMKTQKN
jgi:hypothetical protein